MPERKYNFLKNVKRYFFEFLMLFIAISLSFFVENKREYFSEREQEVEYMKSMIEDLKSDTTILAENIRLRNTRIAMIDSLIYLLKIQKKNEHGNEIYYFARVISIPTNAFPSDRTIQQLKSSGRVRLIHKIHVSNAIMNYYQIVQKQFNDLQEERGIREEYRILVRKILDGNVLNEMVRNNSMIKPSHYPKLMTNNEYIINEFIVQINYIKKSHQLLNEWSEKLILQADHLIQIIQLEYNLE